MRPSYWFPTPDLILVSQTAAVVRLATISFPSTQREVEDADEYLGLLGLRVKEMIEGYGVNRAIAAIEEFLPDTMEIPLSPLLNYHQKERDIPLSLALAEGLTLANWGLIELLEKTLLLEFPLASVTQEAAATAQALVQQTQLEDWLIALNDVVRPAISAI